jgi:hypothetical protein
MARQPCAHCQSARGLNPNDRFLAGRCNVNPHVGSVAERGLVIRLMRGTAATLLAPRASRVDRASTDRDIERRCPAPIDSTSFFGVAPYWTGRVAHRFARMLRLPALISPGWATSRARRRAPSTLRLTARYVSAATLDLAKDVFQVALANRAGRIIERQRLTRRQFERFLETLTDDIEVVMESCGTAHYWGRRLQSRGVHVRLLPVQYVRPYVRRNKTDRADTYALLEAARCGEIRPVPVKTVEQQTLQAIHRIRTQWQTARVARINVMRGLLAEHGHAIPVGARTVLRRVTAILSDPDAAIPTCCVSRWRSSSTKSTDSRRRSPDSIASSGRSPARIPSRPGSKDSWCWRADGDRTRGIRWSHSRVSSGA